MARRRFFVHEVRNGVAELEGDEARHLTQVLRVEAGEIYEICDNAEVFSAEVETARKQRVVFRVIDKLTAEPAPPPVTLLVSLFKFERLELLLEKATELGVSEVQFVRAERSEKGLDQGAQKRIARWQRIVVEASQQSRRSRLPVLHPPMPLERALKMSADQRLVLDEDREGESLLDVLHDYSPMQSIALLVGPEGGWPDHERQLARDEGWSRISLGPNVLRTETAAVSALAVINSLQVSTRRKESPRSPASSPQESS